MMHLTSIALSCSVLICMTHDCAGQTLAAGDSHSVVIRPGGQVDGWGFNFYGQADSRSGPFTRIAAGQSFTVGILVNGQPVGWGSNAFGQISFDESDGQLSAIAAGARHTVALRDDGTLVAWGHNNVGQTDVPAGVYTQIACGKEHSLALTSEGEVVGWGSNDDGQLDAPPGPYTAISAGESFSMALRTNGTIEAWGSPADGILAVPAGTFKAISAGDRHAVAIRELDGVMVGWGKQDHGRAPALTPGLSFNTVATGGSHTIGILEDGTMVGFGLGTPPHEGSGQAIAQAGPFLGRDCNFNALPDLSDDSSGDLNLDFERWPLLTQSPNSHEESTGSIDADSGWVVIGAPGEPGGGAVYVCRRRDACGFALIQRLVGDDTVDGDQFGHAVAISNDVIAIGAPNKLHNGELRGAAYVFSLRDDGSWGLDNRVISSFVYGNAMFGTCVATDGGIVLVGAPGEGDAPVLAVEGSVTEFARSQTSGEWLESLTYTAEQESYDGNRFGASVAITGNRIIIAAAPDSEPGFVEVLEWSDDGTFDSAERHIDPANDPNSGFGTRIAASGDFLAIGALSGGEVYVYRLGTPGSMTLFTSDYAAFDVTSRSLALHDHAGTTQVWHYYDSVDLWLNRHSFSDFEEQHASPSVALDYDDLFLSGVQLNSVPGPTAWSLNTYEQGNDCNLNEIPDCCEPDCNANDIPDECDIGFGTSVDDDGDGIPDECAILVSCPADCSPPGGNTVVNIDDLLEVVQAMSTQNLSCDVSPSNGDGSFGNGLVNIDDLLAVIGAFGPCP